MPKEPDASAGSIRPRDAARIAGFAVATLAVTVAVVVALPAATAASGGPDGFGYRFVDSHEDGGPDDAWPEFLGGPRDEPGFTSLDPVPIGFSFPFYGERYTHVYVCPQGYLTFTKEVPCQGAPDDWTGAGEDDLTSSDRFEKAEADNVIAPYWTQDTHTFGRSGQIQIGVSTDPDVTDLFAPSVSANPFVVRFEGNDDCNTNTGVDVQVALLPNGTIRYHYRPLYEVCDPLIGIESPDGTYNLAYPAPEELPLAFGGDYRHQLRGEAIRWTPPCETAPLVPGEDPDLACVSEDHLDGDAVRHDRGL